MLPNKSRGVPLVNDRRVLLVCRRSLKSGFRAQRKCANGQNRLTRSRMPSRPGELHPEPLTDPDLTLSRHPARATARRVPPSVENWRLLLLPVGSLPTALTCLLRSTSIKPPSSLLQGSPPLSGASVLSASRLEPLAPFPLPSPARFSRSVPEAD